MKKLPFNVAPHDQKTSVLGPNSNDGFCSKFLLKSITKGTFVATAVVSTINDELGSIVSVEFAIFRNSFSLTEKAEVKKPKRNFKILIWKESFAMKSDRVF